MDILNKDKLIDLNVRDISDTFTYADLSKLKELK